MANGYWGSRWPIENLLCTKIIFLLLNYRLARLRIKNKLRHFRSPPDPPPGNDSSTRQLLFNWMSQGYDKLNIGGGPKNLDGFINIDFMRFPSVQRQITANILDLEFIPDECVSHVHSNHVIEHLSPPQMKSQMNTWHRILKKGGLLTLRCPNALGAAYGFWFEPVIESGRDEYIRLGFPYDEDFGNPEDRWVHRDFFGLIHWFYGDVGNIANQHLSIVTPSIVNNSLANAGFEVLKITEPEALNIAIIARKRDGV